MTSGEALEIYKNHLTEIGSQTTVFSKIGSTLKSIGGTLLSTFANMAVMYAASAAIEAIGKSIYNAIYATEIAIEKGEQARKLITDIGDAYTSKQNTVSTNKDRYVELSQGVDNATNQNLSLTTDQYSEFLSISNQLAETFPSLVTGYDSQGNALLSLSGNADDTSASLEKLLEQERQLADFKISQNLQTAFDGTMAQIGQLQDEIDGLNESIDLYNTLSDSMSKMTDGTTLSDLGFTSSEDTAFMKQFVKYGDTNGQEAVNVMQQAFTKAAKDAGLEENVNFSSLVNQDIFKNGENGYEWSAQLWGATKEQLETFKSSYMAYMDEMGGDVAEYTSDALLLKQQDTQEIQANWQSMVQSLITSMSVYDGYNKLGDNIKQAINTGIGKIDPVKEWMDENGEINAPSNIRGYLREKFLDPITSVLNDESLSLEDKNSFQNTIDSIFSLDKSTLSSQEYQNQLNSYLDSIRKFFDSDEKFNDFVLTFGFKVQTDDGQIIDSRDSLINSISDRIGKGNDTSADITSLDELTYEQLVNVETKYTDSSNGKTLAEIIEEETAKAQNTIDSNPITFSSLFEDDSEGSLTKYVDTFQSNISTIDSSLTSLKNGEKVNLTDLTQQFPDLIGQTDNLEEALNKLKTGQYEDVISKIFDSISEKGIIDQSEIDNATQFIQNLFDGIDISQIELGNIKNGVTSQLLSKANGVVERQMATDYVNNLFDGIEIKPKSISEIINSDTISKAVSEYTSKISTLKNAQQEYNKTGKLSASTTKDLYENISDATDYADDLAGSLDDMIKAADTDVMASFNDEIKKLEQAGDYSGADALRQYAQSVMESANEIEGAYQKIGELKIETPQMQAVDEASSTDNGGKIYEDMLSKKKTAEDLFKNGLTGTDDFKSFAAMISPTGSDDVANFAENIGKFNRYFTEGSEGCQNFLSDLKELGYAEQDGSKWTYNLGNNMQELKAAAEQMGIGFEPFMAMFGRLEDYGAYNDFFVTEEQGTQHLNSLYKDLAAEKQRLAEIEANPRTSNYETARQESLDKIAQYEERIAQTKKDINNLDATNAEYMKEKAEYSKNVAQSMLDEINATNDDALKQSLKDQLDAFAEEYHLKINYDTGSITNLEEAIEGIDFKVNLDATGSDLDEQISGMTAYLAELRSGGTVGVDTSEITNAETVLSYLIEKKQELEQPAVMSVDDSQLSGVNDEISSAITAIQNFQSAYNQLQETKALGLDTSEAEANLQNAKTELDSIDDETKKTLNFEVNGEEDIDTIIDKIQNLDLSSLDASIQNLSYHFNIDNEDDLDAVIQKIKDLPTETQSVHIALNTDDVDETKITNLTTALNSLPKTVQNIIVTVNTEDADTGKISAINSGLSKIAETHPNTTVTVNGEQAVAVIRNIQGKLNAVGATHPNPTISATDAASGTIQNVSSELAGLNGKSAHTFVYTHHVNLGKSEAHGNAKAHGNARNFGGLKGEPKDTVALTGELKPELVVRGDEFFTVGDNGPEMVHLQKGDIIFDGDQTEDILKKGHTRRRGRALSKGNARSGGIDWSKSGNNGGSGSSSGTKSTGKTSSGTTKDTTSKDTSSDEEKSKIDWIEKALDRINQKINRIKTNVSNIYRSFADRRKSLKNELSYVEKEIKAQQKALAKYEKYANEIELDESIKKKVRHGSYSIGEYDKDTQKLIQEYEDLYKKQLDCNDALIELKNTLAEIAREKFDMVIQEWTDKLTDLQHVAERTNSLIDRRTEYASEYLTSDKSITASRQNISDYQSLIENSKTQQSTIAQERDALKQELANMLADKNSGITKGSQGYNEMVKEIQDLENQYDELGMDIITYSNKISEEYVNMFDTVSQDYENKLDMAEHLATEYNNALELAEAKGLITTSGYYEQMQKIEQEKLNMYNQQAEAMNKALYEAIASGEIEVGSQAYYDMRNSINQVTEAAQEAEIKIEELNNSIRQVKWDQFDYTRDRVADLNDEIEFMISLMKDAKLVDDKGFFTDEGLATIGMYGTEYNTLMSEADEYAAEIKRINAEIANDPYDTKLIERKNQLLQKQRELIQSANDQKQAIKDLVEDGIKAQLDSLKELISTYTDALDRQKDLYDYQKRISEQTKNINKLQKELSAYDNDLSEETKAKVQQIKVELEEARADLEETQYDNYISQQKQILDDLYDEYEKALNERLDNLDLLMEEMIATANANAITINDTLVSTADSVGYTMSDSLNSIWGSAQSTMLDNTQTLLDELVNNGKISRENADDIIKALGTGTSDQVNKTQEVIEKLIENGSLAESDAEQIRSTITNQTSDTSVLAMYGRNFNDKQTTTNNALSAIKEYVSSLVAEAERQAVEAQQKIEQEQADREKQDQQAQNEGKNNGTKGDAANAVNGSLQTTDQGNADIIEGQNPVKEPETPVQPGKAEPPKKTNSKSTQGDGKVQVGDKVKFNSGSYYYSSDGISPVGSDYHGKQVYITSINKASWATKPYHISTGKKLGSGDLGWVTKSQISGYASGAKRIGTEGLAWTNENWDTYGAENIVRKSDHAVLTRVGADDRIYNAMASENMWQFANNPMDFINKSMQELRQTSTMVRGGNITVENNFDNITFDMPGVSNYEDFVYKLQHDGKFEKLIQSMTIDALAGKGTKGKYRINF